METYDHFFCMTFLKQVSRVVRHTKTKEFKEKFTSCQNDEGCKDFEILKTFLFSRIAKKDTMWVLLDDIGD